MTEGLVIGNLAAGYRGRSILAGFTLSPIPAGSVAAVIGPNAAGKSTLLKAVAGLLRASGAVTLDGQPLSDLDLARRARLIGFLPQTPPQPSALLAYETVLGALRAVRPEMVTAEVEAAVESTFATLDLNDLALRPLDRMSGGERQMVGLAQAIVRRPRLLLLDEPTSALDLRRQLDTLSAIRAIAASERATALVAMHDINLALRFVDRLIVMGPGRLVAEGPPDSVLTPDVLRRTYGIEARVEHCSQGLPIVIADRTAA